MAVTAPVAVAVSVSVCRVPCAVAVTVTVTVAVAVTVTVAVAVAVAVVAFRRLACRCAPRIGASAFVWARLAAAGDGGVMLDRVKGSLRGASLRCAGGCAASLDTVCA